MNEKLHVQPFILGPMYTNCFVLWFGEASEDRRCWIIDVGIGPQPMFSWIEQHQLQPEGVYLTHGHVDHIAGLNDLHLTWPDVPIYIHEAETKSLSDPAKNLSAAFGQPVTAPPATGTLTHGQNIELDAHQLGVLHVPGHSPGSVVFVHRAGNWAIVGDTLFADSIGRTDFPDSDLAALLRGIREHLLTLPDDCQLYPGHGPQTTPGSERDTNPFIQ